MHYAITKRNEINPSSNDVCLFVQMEESTKYQLKEINRLPNHPCMRFELLAF